VTGAGPTTSDDPGWKPVLAYAGSAALPALAMRKARAIDDRLVGLRLVFVAEVVLYGLSTIVALVAFGGAWSPVLSPAAAGAGVALVVVGASMARAKLAAGLPNGDTGADLVDNYRARFTSQMAIINLLLGFAVIGGILSQSAVVFLLGLAAGAANLVLAAPTASRLADDQRRLTEAGTVVDLVAALRTSGADGFGPTKKKRRR